jgi:hypothetical protein
MHLGLSDFLCILMDLVDESVAYDFLPVVWYDLMIM